MQIYNELCDIGVELFKIDLRKTKHRDSDIVNLRYAYAHILLTRFGLNTVQVGNAMNKDHSTIVYYRKLHRGRYKSDEEYERTYDMIVSKLDRIKPQEMDEIISVIKIIGQ